MRSFFTWRYGSSFIAIAAGLWIFWLVARSFIPIVHNPECSAFVTDSGKILCADRSLGGSLVADRDRIGWWERFVFRHNPDSSYTILTYSGQPLAADKDGLIRATSAGKTLPSFFIDSIAGKVYVRDAQSRYWHAGEDLKVRLGPKEQALSLTIRPVRIPIPDRQYFFIFIALTLILAACFMIQVPRTEKAAIWVLLGATVSLMLFCITFFDFIFIWDEQYHALVAKNMMEDPFRPVLLKYQLLPIDPTHWISNHLWLHKQPLFMWQMALAMRVFGVSEWAFRIPDLVMVTIMTAAVYRTGTLLADRKTGFFAALFMTVSHFIFLLASGAQFTDHNDLAFLFYTMMSIWSWIEYESRREEKSRFVFLVLTGVFAGGAVLVKWLPGLLVFAGWGLMILLERERRIKFRSYLEILFGVLVCAAVFLPWQIYTLSVFPAETLHEFKYATLHYTVALDGHTGDGLGWRYHLEGLRVVYKIGLVSWLLMVPVLFMVVPRKKLAFSLVFMIVLFYLFFTLGATKMPAYVFPVAGIFFLILAATFRMADSFLEMVLPLRLPRILLVASLLLWLSTYFLVLNTTLMVYYPIKTDRNNLVNQRSAYAGFFREFGSVMPKEDQKNTVILNCPVDHCPSMMFYTDLKAVYPFRDEQSYLRLKAIPGIKVVYMDVGDAPVPEYILRDSSVTRIFVPPYLDKYYR